MKLIKIFLISAILMFSAISSVTNARTGSGEYSAVFETQAQANAFCSSGHVACTDIWYNGEGWTASYDHVVNPVPRKPVDG